MTDEEFIAACRHVGVCVLTEALEEYRSNVIDMPGFTRVRELEAKKLWAALVQAAAEGARLGAQNYEADLQGHEAGSA